MLENSASAMGRLAAAFSAATFIFVTTTATLDAQVRDSARTDSTRAQKLERVMIAAVRGGTAAPISQKTLTSADLQPRYFGQDVPMLLQGAAPSLTSYAETGNYWGYSYIRLRGIDQSRINLTLDGIPLNDPEDQVLYFADFPDLTNSLNTVQVQRGVGTSSNGTAAYAGSINMETVPLSSPRGGNLQVERGSFGSRRESAEWRSGLTPSRFAAYARISDLHTDGYREHSNVTGRSIFLSGGYFGDRDVLKATLTTGTMRDTMAYLAVAQSDLDTNRRINPLTTRERDQFTERIAALTYTHQFTPSSSWTTTGYRTSADGDYDVVVDSLWNFRLKFVTYGATTDWSYRAGALQLDLGGNADTYARDHSSFIHPDYTDLLYFNTGHKQDASGFAKLAYTTGAATWFADLQGRHAHFSYTPDVHAGITERSIDWNFVNPKVGVSYAADNALTFTASYGKNSREPTRTDMFAGADNMDSTNVASIGDLSRVKPETVHDVEAGAVYRTQTFQLSANLYSMDFRNEIAPIGALSLTGSPLRENVAQSYRRGIEADATYRGIRRLTLAANAALSKNRIKQYVDSSGDTPVTFNNVPPLLTPEFQTFGRATFDATRTISLSVEARYQSQSYLQNTGDDRFVLPASFDADASLTWRYQSYEIAARVNNLTDSKKFGSGYASGGESYYFVLPPRNFFITMKLAF